LEQQELELLAAIGQVVVNATVLEYQIAALVAVMEGRDRDRARELARRTGEAMRQLEKQVKARPGRADLRRLHRDAGAVLENRQTWCTQSYSRTSPQAARPPTGSGIPAGTRRSRSLPRSYSTTPTTLQIVVRRALALIERRPRRLGRSPLSAGEPFPLAQHRWHLPGYVWPDWLHVAPLATAGGALRCPDTP